MNNRHSESAKNILKDLHDFVEPDSDEIVSMPLTRINSELVALGVNVDRPSEKVLTIFARVKAKEDLARAVKERERLILRFKERAGLTQDTLTQTKESLVALVKKMFKEEEAFAYCRKFENADKDDLETLIADLMLLDEIKEDDVG